MALLFSAVSACGGGGGGSSKLQVVDAATQKVVLTGTAATWNGGATDDTSGDRAWWFDFSAVTAPGTYEIVDADRQVRSPRFAIAANVYRPVLVQAVRTFFYQRAGHAKAAQFAGAGWADGASHLGPLQDANARRYDAPGDAATERDLRGGWYDAGDYNKYTNWTAGYVVDLLHAYAENKPVWTDDFNITESGNGVPDLLDEVKWGLDWLVRMQNTDGSVLSIVGLGSGSPPSSATSPSHYGNASTSATLASAAAYACGAKEFAGLNTPAFNAYAAAALTGDATYRAYVDVHYTEASMFASWWLSPFNAGVTRPLLYHASLPGATAATANDIRTRYVQLWERDDYAGWGAIKAQRDPYRAYISDYTWGSNGTKALAGGMFADEALYALGTHSASEIDSAGAGYLHYLHGVNPLAKVYLSNMANEGTWNSVDQFFHSWFVDGSARWDSVKESTYGPAPGFLVGGPNPSQYNWDERCPGISPQCGSAPPSPPFGQPAQKAFKDFNTGWPLNSWPITENSNGYQTAYIRLLARYVK